MSAGDSPVGRSPTPDHLLTTVRIEQEMSPELTVWIVEQSLSTPPLMPASLLADAGFCRNEAEAVDAVLPSLFVVAEHWAGTAKALPGGVSQQSGIGLWVKPRSGWRLSGPPKPSVGTKTGDQNRQHGLCTGETTLHRVELTGLEPVTSCMPCKRSSKLSYSPRLL